jgi:hypothetical protein
MKVGKKEISLLVAVAGILAAVIVAFLVYIPYKDQTEILKKETAALKSRAEELKGYEEEIPRYERENEAAKEDVREILTKFPVKSLEEDAVLYAANLEARNSNTSIASVGIGEPELVYSVGPTSVYLTEEDEAEGNQRTFQLFRQQITFANQFSYNGMKQFVKDIVDDENSRTIETMSVSYDRGTGILVGNTTMNLFTLTGSDAEYDRPVISGIDLGTDNIFGTLVSPSEEVFDN